MLLAFFHILLFNCTEDPPLISIEQPTGMSHSVKTGTRSSKYTQGIASMCILTHTHTHNLNIDVTISDIILN